MRVSIIPTAICNIFRLNTYILVCMGLIFSFLVYQCTHSFSNLSLTDIKGKKAAIEFPFSKKSPTDGRQEYVVEGILNIKLLSSKKYRFFADTEVLEVFINGHKINISSSTIDRSNKATGFILDLSDSLKIGENSITMRFADWGGYMKARISAPITPTSIIFLLFAICTSLILIARFFLFYRHSGLNWLKLSSVIVPLYESLFKVNLLGLSIAAIFLSIISYQCLYSFSNFSLVDSKGTSTSIEFPYESRSPVNGEARYIFEGELHLKHFSPKTYRFMADTRVTSLSVNGKNIDLSLVPEKDFGNKAFGIAIDLTHHLNTGKNIITLSTIDWGGRIKANAQGIFHPLLVFGWLLIILIASKKFLRYLGLSNIYCLLIMSGIAIRLLYFSLTDYVERSHDVDEHIDYILHFVNTWSLPALDKARGGAYFHPPIYYFLSAIAYSFIDYTFNFVEYHLLRCVQFLSLLFSAGFTIYAAKASTLFFMHEKNPAKLKYNQLIAFTCAATAIFWPTGVMHATRISSDPLLYFSFAAGFYYLLKYHLHGSLRSFYIFLAFSALAVAAKANGILLLGIGGITFLCKLYIEKQKFNQATWVKLILATSLCGIIGGATFLPGILLKLNGSRTHVYVDNITNVPKSLQVGNKAENYLWFDLKVFITKPRTDSTNDSHGRQYFWNFLAKTSLVGASSWRFTKPIAHNAIGVLSFSFILIVILSVYGSYHIPIKILYYMLPIYLTFFLLFAAVTYMRMTFPVNINFRYILPVIIPCCIIYNQGLISLKNLGKHRLYATGITIEIVFTLSSILLLLNI